MKLLFIISSFFFFLGFSWADYQVWKVSRFGKKIIVKLEPNEFIKEGDRLYLQNDEGKCWTEVTKVRGPYALLSSKHCSFSAERGNRLVHRDYFLESLEGGGHYESFDGVDDDEDRRLNEDRKRGKKKVKARGRARRRSRSNKMVKFFLSVEYSVLDKFSYQLDSQDDSEDYSAEGTAGSRLRMGGKILIRQPRWRQFGVLGGIAYQFNQNLELENGGEEKRLSSFSSLQLEGNLCYFINRNLFIYGGGNYLFPLKGKLSEGQEVEDGFQLGGLLSFQAGGGYQFNKSLVFSLSYRQDNFFSSYSDGDDQEEFIGVYRLRGVIGSLSVGF